MRKYTIGQFKEKIVAEITKNKNNNYTDNWDYSLFGEYAAPVTLRSRLKPLIEMVLPDKYYAGIRVDKYLGSYMEGLTFLHNNLENEEDAALLIQILTFRVAGHEKIKLPLSRVEYWEQLRKTSDYVVKDSETIDVPSMKMKLLQYNLNQIGFPITLWFLPFGVMADFVVKQYEYEKTGVSVKPVVGDVIIDAGACWGDTALYFSYITGGTGRVYSFEFVPSNIEIFFRNLNQNPSLRDNIELVERPIWSESGQDVYFTNNGPSSRVSMSEFEGYFGKTTTLSIDDLVMEKGLSTVDFIKMDIEGAEPYALKGAEATLIAFKPKLAISIYHNLEHFSSILKYIQSLNLGYKFYLKHATVHAQETILFATAR